MSHNIAKAFWGIILRVGVGEGGAQWAEWEQDVKAANPYTLRGITPLPHPTILLIYCVYIIRKNVFIYIMVLFCWFLYQWHTVKQPKTQKIQNWSKEKIIQTFYFSKNFPNWAHGGEGTKTCFKTCVLPEKEGVLAKYEKYGTLWKYLKRREKLFLVCGWAGGLRDCVAYFKNEVF